MLDCYCYSLPAARRFLHTLFAALPADICGTSARAPAYTARERCVEATDSRRDPGELPEGMGWQQQKIAP